MPSDPVTRLALAMASNPGVYALLIGSGVSTGTGMPTGWGVQVALMRKVAVAEGAEVDLDDGNALAVWWQEAHGSEPSYSALLEELAATSEERRAILRGFFVPSDEERQQGLKVPGRAHEGIARLVLNRAVRLILTTNFDSLIEQVLEAHGVDHDVWASAEEIEGGIPLDHGRVVVVKVHGDYRRADLRNTVSELSAYPSALNDLLDRVLDAFGLVVCGWSADHDIALQKALRRSTNRRYSCWWALRGDEAAETAAQLIRHREAILVQRRMADEFFGDLADRHAAVADSTASPTEMAVERGVTAQRAADRTQHQSLLEGLLRTARDVRDAVSDEQRFPRLGHVIADEVLARAAALLELARPLMEQVAQVVAAADSDIALDVIERIAEILFDVDRHAPLSRLPLLLVWYGIGITAVDHGRFDLFRRASVIRMPGDHRPEPLVAIAHPWRIVDNEPQAAQWLANDGPQERKFYTPMSVWLERVMKDLLEPFPAAATDHHWQQAFDRFEWASGLLLSAQAHLTSEGQDQWIPPAHVGNFGWRHEYKFFQSGGQWASLREWASEHEESLLSGLDSDARREAISAHLKRVEELSQGWL